MVDFKVLKQEIDLIYREFKSGKITDMNRFYELLSKYIRKTIENIIQYRGYVDQNAVEDLLQDTLLDVFENGIYNYKVLSSPTWAFEELKDKTLQYSADRFIIEFNRRLSKGRIAWGPLFLDQMEEEEFGVLIKHWKYAC